MTASKSIPAAWGDRCRSPAQILYTALPVCWLLVGIASLVFRPARVEVVLP
jgi:hypothetical protein